MKNLKLTLLAFAVFASTFASAQTEKGSMLLGGTAGFGAQFNEFNDVFSVNIFPDFGYFAADGIAVGASLNFGYSKADESDATSFGFIPFARYYLNQGNAPMFFLQAKIGVVTNRIDNGFGANTVSGAVFGGGPGMAIFLTDQIAIEGILDVTRYAGDFQFTDLGLLFGVQAYLSRAEK